nr:MAG TPA: hypothetical protein [Bacteriophage sp.]
MNQIWPIVPYGAFTISTPTIPKFYWDVYSQEQRWKAICEEIGKLSDYASAVAEVYNALDASKADKTALADAVKGINEQLAALKQLIEQLQIGALQWDVQHGDYRDTVDAQRDMFNDLSVHSMTIAEFNTLDMTVNELADCGLNCRGLAVMSYWLTDEFDISGIYKTDESQTDGKKFTTNFLRSALVNANGFVYVPKEVQQNA